jgi:Mn-containing catalase
MHNKTLQYTVRVSDPNPALASLILEQFGGGPSLTNSSGVPFSGAYVDSRGDPSADLRSNIAAEGRAKIIYERLINITDDPGIKDALGFLMTREVAHQKSFEKALYSIDDNFPTGKLPGLAPFASLYVNTSQGDGDVDGPWYSGEQWDRIDDVAAAIPLDGGDGLATVKLGKDDKAVVAALAARTASDASANPATGADLGAGPGAGRMSDEDMGGAKDMPEAAAMADAETDHG